MSADSENLRGVVRELLAELLQTPERGIGDALGSGMNGRNTAVGEEVIDVALRNDAELRDLVLRVLDLVEDPIRRHAVRTGRIRFRLARGVDPQQRLGEREAQTLRIDRGALTEKTVAAAARDGQSIVLGRRAVATPLALDKARTLGVSVRKEAA
jgi:hypothetical protein